MQILRHFVERVSGSVLDLKCFSEAMSSPNYWLLRSSYQIVSQCNIVITCSSITKYYNVPYNSTHHTYGVYNEGGCCT